MRNNVTEVYFNGQEMTTILVHWQHDYKQILKFADLDLPFSYEVDFANTGDNQSKTMLGNADGVEIPDEYLMTGKAINAYIYLHDASDSGETVRKVSIQVHGRPERTEEIPDQHQQSLIEQAIATLDAAVEQTASDVQTTGEYKEEAHGYADEAKGYAERAESAESEVEGYATRAETAESHAQGYAQTASDKASEASGYVDDARRYSESASSFASDAQASSEASYLSAQSSSRYASDASGYSSSAYESAQSASGSASDASSAKDLAVQAKDDAISAKNDAVSAKNDAETAKGKAEDAQEIAERAAGSVLGLTADATVDSNTGTPSVEVDVSTVSDHKNMSFSFHNLKGVPGTPGQDGFSPTVSVTEISGGHEVEVVDAEGTQTFNVMDGLDGQSGLITDYIAEEKTPYLFRPSAKGLANVISEKDTLIGGTVAWNQKYNYSTIHTETINGITFTVNSDGTIVANGTASADAYKSLNISTGNNVNAKIPRGHKFYMGGCPSGGGSSTYCIMQRYLGGSSDTGNGTITWDSNSQYSGAIGILIKSGVTANNLVFKPIVSDLTAMFGSTIADYLYTLESGSSGSGIAKLKEWGFFTKDYYPYNSGDLQSVQTSAHVMRGFNQWDKSTDSANKSINIQGQETNANNYYLSDYIKVIPNTDYYFKDVAGSSYAYASGWYDADKNFIMVKTIPGGYAVSGVLKSPENACYVRATRRSGVSDEACISVSGSKNGTYEPYSVHSYPLDSDLVLRGALKLDAQNNLYYDGDTYESDGTVTRKYGIIDLGTLTWTYVASDTVFYATISDKRDGLATVRCGSRYMPGGLTGYSTPDYLIGQSSNASLLKRIFISDPNYNTASAFKASLDGIYLVYELATPTTETADPFAQYQIVDADGTEEYVDERTVPIPVGHDTYYQQAVDVPQLPTADGQYQLNLTKVGNTAVASWGIISQTSMVASANIQNGKYFNIGEKLYLASRAISQGESIVVGTNCSEVSLADALNQINA